MLKIFILFAVYATIVLAIYAVCPKKFRYIVLLLSSLICYAVYSKFLIFFLILTIAIIYIAGILINKNNIKYKELTKDLDKEQRKKLKKKGKKINAFIMIFAILLNLAILFTLKYFNFFALVTVDLLKLFKINASVPMLKLLLPLGISYYTLQSLSYIIDVACGKYQAEKNPLKLALFVSFFPQLFEGPLGRYNELSTQLFEGKKICKENVSGVYTIFWGLFKIIIVSFRLSMITGEIFKNYQQYSGIVILFGTIAFTVQLYAEFSGYIDIAKGISKLFGINLAKNFDKPFISKDVSEFWRRWHISLGAWFRDYVFYPISMSNFAMNIRRKFPKAANVVVMVIALFVVWFLTGLWHGASFKYIIYGLYYFALMMLHELLKPIFSRIYKKFKISEKGIRLSIVRIVKTFILICLGMLIFRAENVYICGKMFASIFSNSGEKINILNILDLKEIIVLCLAIIAIIASGIISAKDKIIITEVIVKKGFALQYIVCFSLFIFIIIFGAYGMGYIPPDPIYGAF